MKGQLPYGHRYGVFGLGKMSAAGVGRKASLRAGTLALCAPLGAGVLALALTVVLLVVGLPLPCRAQALNGSTVVFPSDLAAEVRRYDGQQVTLRGEVIGTVMRRGEHVWVNVGDGSTAVGVCAPVRILEEIGPGGGYARHGDTVEVTGVFHAACSLHGGDPDLHAMAWQVLEQGRPREHRLPMWRWGMATVLVGAGLVLTAVATRLTSRG